MHTNKIEIRATVHKVFKLPLLQNHHVSLKGGVSGCLQNITTNLKGEKRPIVTSQGSCLF